MKETPSDEIGFLPRIANRMLMVTSVRPMAISGETSAIVLERSARFSSTNCMRGLLRLEAASTHQETEFLAAGVGRLERLRQMAVEHHGDPVGDLGEFVEILARHQDGGAGGGEIEQRLPDHGGGAGVDAPGRLADDEHGRVAEDFAADDEFLPNAARPAPGFPVALGLSDIKSLRRAIDRLP